MLRRKWRIDAKVGVPHRASQLAPALEQISLGIMNMERKVFKKTLPQLKRSLPQNISDFEYLKEMPLGENVEFENTEISSARLKEIVRLLNISAEPPFRMTIRERFDGKGWVVIRTDEKPKPRPNGAGRRKKVKK